MEIKINEEMIQNTLNEKASEAVQSAMTGYAMRAALEKVVTESTLPQLMSSAIRDAADEIDLAVLRSAIAAQMTKTVVKSVNGLIRESLVNIICDLRKVPEYDRDKRNAERVKIIAEYDL